MSDDGRRLSGEAASDRLSNAAVRIVERNGTAVYIDPRADSNAPRCVFYNRSGYAPQPHDTPPTDLTDLQRETTAIPLSQIVEQREFHERTQKRGLESHEAYKGDGVTDKQHRLLGQLVADRHRKACQDEIELCEIIDRAVAYVQSDEPDVRERHLRRISVLCDDPPAVIRNVDRALAHDRPARSTRYITRFREIARQLFSANEEGERDD